ncbi:sugar transferase [Labilibacter sediminis]|nr:sugar transferase [Labilibacter sediminis]
MLKKQPGTIQFKRINDKLISNLHLGADIIALIACHLIFLGKYRLPYRDIFSPLLPVELKAHAIPLAIVCVILIWLFAFYLSGHYANTARKSGIQIFGPTISTCFIMSVMLFFILLSYSPVELNINPLMLSSRYFFVVFILVYSFRMIIISRLHYLIKTKRVGYKTVLIGNNQQALKIIKDYYKTSYHLGNQFAGYISEDDVNGEDLSGYIPHLGNTSNLKEIIEQQDIDEAIVSLQLDKHEAINKVINILRQKEILIKLSTDLNAMLEGTVKTQNLESLPFITIGTDKIPVWQGVFKRFFDITMAWFGLLVSSPIFIAIAIGVKLSSKGSIFYSQERIGRHKKPFHIYKFRSMHVDAEKNGPSLSSENDPRITPFGRFMRKWRLDEMPQFINIILGDMSFVGPRPERKYFIDQILPLAPHYEHLFTVRPGITSWGMVKFGYAENIDQMIERLQYDILYLENRTLVVDFKILLYTLKTIFSGEGK